MKELLQMALDALIYHRDQTRPIERSDSAIAALRAALAAPIPEPVAWAMLRADGLVLDVICPDERDAYQGEYTVPLYAAPPAAPAPADTEGCAACVTCGQPWPAAPVVRESQDERDARIEALQTECDASNAEGIELTAQVAALREQNASQSVHIISQGGEIEGLREDAERYRWLRDPHNQDCHSVGKCTPDTESYEAIDWLYGDELDVSIDAALAARKGTT